MLHRPIFYVSILIITTFWAPLQATRADQQQNKGGWLEAIVSYQPQKEETVKDSAWQPVSSDVITYMQPPHFFSVDISSQPYLTLITTDAGDSVNFDRAIWANAKLISADGTEVWLDMLKPFQVDLEFGEFHAREKERKIGTVTFQRFIRAHANSVVVYQLDPEKKYTTFQAYAGLEQNGSGGTVKFIVQNKIVKTEKDDLNDFWKPLVKEFPDDSAMIMAARDWMRRDRLILGSDNTDFEQKTKEALEFTKKTLAYVEKAADCSELKAKLKRVEQ
ncbi:MAG: hypothetical protein FVQ79_09565, partial [Planctomycetes bacterium]|nr:hypothetical protein [Planctomycetota bacterium]